MKKVRTYAAKKAGIYMSAHHLPCIQTTLYISSYSRSVEYIPVGSVDTKIEKAGSGMIVSLGEVADIEIGAPYRTKTCIKTAVRK